MRVSLAIAPDPALRPQGAETDAVALLDPRGPEIVVGGRAGGDGLAAPIAPRAEPLFGARGAALAGPQGPLVVADTGHHRLLVWHRLPAGDHAAADVVIGQPDMASEGRNAKGAASAATLNVPTGVAVADGVLAVADAWNHRVLIWTRLPERSNQPADLVLGQADFSGAEANRGGEAGADTLNWCYGVSLIAGRLFVADTGNRRVLVWDMLPERNGQPADRVLGQRSFACRDESAGEETGPLGMRWPHGVATIGEAVLVSDAGTNRVMVWKSLPEEPGVPCEAVLGQEDFASVEHNRGRYWPDAAALNMPYAIATAGDWLIAADTANSRLVGWRQDTIGLGAAAEGLTGQPDFSAKGDNRWQLPARDSLCWPYGVTSCGDTVVVADSGNNRVALWGLAP